MPYNELDVSRYSNSCLFREVAKIVMGFGALFVESSLENPFPILIPGHENKFTKTSSEYPVVLILVTDESGII
jgi:hypothetical protein